MQSSTQFRCAAPRPAAPVALPRYLSHVADRWRARTLIASLGGGERGVGLAR